MAVESMDVLNWVIAPATAWTTAGRELGLFDTPDDAPTGAEQRRADRQAAKNKAIRQRRKKRGTDYARGEAAAGGAVLPAVDTSAATTIAASGPSDTLLYAAGAAVVLLLIFSLGRR